MEFKSTILLCLCSVQLFWEKKLSGLNVYDIAEELVKNMEMPKGLQGEWGGPRRDAPCWGLGGYFNTTWAPVSHVAEQHTKLI